MEIYLLRHGTTEWNRQHRIQGRTDVPLDDLGREMARQTGEYLQSRGITFDAVYASPLQRAYETACLVSGTYYENTKILTDDRLIELCFGHQEGQVVEEMVAAGGAFQYFKSAPDRYNEEIRSDETAETLSALYDRAGLFFHDLKTLAAANSHDSALSGAPHSNFRRILISAHGAINKALLMHFLGEKDLANFWGAGLQPNCGFTVLDVQVNGQGSLSHTVVQDNVIYYPEELLSGFSRLL